ncbi:hypothetical protein OROHE_002357 [Orobanche hederae]
MAWSGYSQAFQKSSFFPYSRRVPEENNLVEKAHHQQKLEIGHCKKKPSSNVDMGNSSRQEILKLEKRLQDQVSVRCALEKALGYKTSSRDINNEATIPKHVQNSSSHVISLAEHLRTRIPCRIQETPNKLSEDMVKCMCNIYCKLSDPPLPSHRLPSPASSLSSISISSALDKCDMWSPGFRHDSSFDTRLDNPFLVEGLKDFNGPYSSMFEVHCIYRDSRRLGNIEYLLTNFRSLISRLEEIDPRKMTRDEKLAFWINVHNALVIACIFGIWYPTEQYEENVTTLEAAYNVGGQIISADVIQSWILGYRMSRPGEWLRLLFSSKTKFQASDKRRAYGITRPEPLLYFALSSGSHSDPAVRIFTPKRIFQELEAAKEDYVRATFGVGKDNKIILPKIIDSFAKESGICQAGILEMIQQSLPDSPRKSIVKCQQTKSKKKIEWVPHNFAFRYIIMK